MKRSDNLIRGVSFLIFIAIACYIGYYFYDRLKHPFRTAEAVAFTAEDSFECLGYIVRDEISFDVKGEYIGFEAEKGERVHKGQPVAAIYATEAAYMRARQRDELMLTCSSLDSLLSSDSLRGAVYQDIILLNRAARSGDGKVLASAAIGLDTLLLQSGGEADAAALKAMLDDTRQQVADLDAVSSRDTRYISAAEAGLFSPDCDGFECVGTDDVKNISPTELKMLFYSPVLRDARLITGTSWYFAAVTEYDTAAALDSDKEIYLHLESLAAPLKVAVYAVGLPDKDGMCVVLFSSDRNMNEVLDLRFEHADVITNRREGFSIPLKAIRNDGGDDYIYVISALQARRVDVTVLEENGDQAVVCSDSRLLFEGVSVITEADRLYEGKVVG